MGERTFLTENVLPLRRSGSSGSENILFFLMYKADLYIQAVDVWCECSVKISWEDDYGEKKCLGRLRGENSESCKRSQFSSLRLVSSTIKVIFFSLFLVPVVLRRWRFGLPTILSVFIRLLIYSSSVRDFPTGWWLCFLVGRNRNTRNVDCKKKKWSLSKKNAGLHSRVETSIDGLLSLTCLVVWGQFPCVWNHFQVESRMCCVSSLDLVQAWRWFTFWGPQSHGTTSTTPRRGRCWRRAPGWPTSTRRPSLTSGGKSTRTASCLFTEASGMRKNAHLQDTP